MGVASDPVLAAIDHLEQALDQNAERARIIKERIAHLRIERANGKSWAQIVKDEQTPLVVRLVTDSAMALDEHGVRLRRVEALALYNEGMTMELIAVAFGVSRQRVSTLLKASSG